MEFSRIMHDTCASANSSLANLETFAACPAETAALVHVHGDVSDPCNASWESAWIDLGGEG